MFFLAQSLFLCYYCFVFGMRGTLMAHKNEKNWQAWAIRRNRLDNVLQYIRENIPEVDQYFYPMIKKQYQTKRGIQIKDRPLYEGYLFLHYNNHASVFHKLRECAFVTTFAGPVTDDEIKAMEAVQGKLITEIKASKFQKGDQVNILTGPFRDFSAVVQEIASDQIRVHVDAKILGQDGIDLLFHEEQIERSAELKNTKVQTI